MKSTQINVSCIVFTGNKLNYYIKNYIYTVYYLRQQTFKPINF